MCLSVFVAKKIDFNRQRGERGPLAENLQIAMNSRGWRYCNSSLPKQATHGDVEDH